MFNEVPNFSVISDNREHLNSLSIVIYTQNIS